MYKVTVKRYGFIRWDGHQQISKLVRASFKVGVLTVEEMDRFAKDNTDFLSTIKTLQATQLVKPTDAEALGGLSWTTIYLVGDQVEANAIKDYFGVRVQERINTIDINSGLVLEAEITTV